jgi:hypothetical protein
MQIIKHVASPLLLNQQDRTSPSLLASSEGYTKKKKRAESVGVTTIMKTSLCSVTLWARFCLWVVFVSCYLILKSNKTARCLDIIIHHPHFIEEKVEALARLGITV